MYHTDNAIHNFLKTQSMSWTTGWETFEAM
jgi:hypothetical protein